MVRLVPIENDVIPMVLLVNIHLMWSGWVQGNSNGPLVPMVRLVPMENDAIPMVLLVQNKFAFTPSKNALIIIMNIPRSISQPRNDKFAFTPSKSAL